LDVRRVMVRYRRSDEGADPRFVTDFADVWATDFAAV
jgi:hypothetical protein